MSVVLTLSHALVLASTLSGCAALAGELGVQRSEAPRPPLEASPGAGALRAYRNANQLAQELPEINPVDAIAGQREAQVCLEHTRLVIGREANGAPTYNPDDPIETPTVGTVTLNGMASRCESLVAQFAAHSVGPPPLAAVSDPPLEHRILERARQLAAARGWPGELREVRLMSQDWRSLRNQQTGVVLQRIRPVGVVLQTDTECTYREILVGQDHLGGGNFATELMAEPAQEVARSRGERRVVTCD